MPKRELRWRQFVDLACDAFLLKRGLKSGGNFRFGTKR
jgi:hypothetical protein